jgi:hypothetical protein
MSGDSNAVTGLTITGSGSSQTIFTMPSNGFADTGRTITASGSTITNVHIP